jgi:hypothetical protein
MRAIDNANRAAYAAWLVTNKAYIDGPYKNYLLATQAMALSASQQARAACSGIPQTGTCTVCGGGGIQGITCVSSPCNPQANCEGQKFKEFNLAIATPPQPPPPTLQTYPACSAPNCPPGKKVWTQVLWGSPSGNFTDAKGCFVVAYSQDAPTLPPKVEYNPFLPKIFVESRALSYYLVNGDRYRGLNDSEWKNLESVSGWDKGYWRSEVTDPECRGWRPGWSRKIK